MSRLRAAVFVAKPIPFIRDGVAGSWSPISCTLIYDTHSALLVDTAIDIEQNRELVAWIQRVAPGRNLETIYITHGHPDHWFGIPLILEKFPQARVLATQGTVNHAKQAVEPQAFAKTWGAWFGDRIPQPFVLPEPFEGDSRTFLLNSKWECRSIEMGHTDTHDTTVLWVPDLRLVAAGDVIYGQVHQLLSIATSSEKRAEWLKAIDAVESLDPKYVIAGHQQAEEVHGSWNIASTRAYIQYFARILEDVRARGGSWQELYDGMMDIHGDRANPMILRWGVKAQFGA